MKTTQDQLADARKEAAAAKARLNQARAEVQALTERGSGTKLVRVYASNSNIDVRDDPTATMDPVVLQGDGENLSVTRPSGIEVLLLVDGCCMTVTADDIRGVKAAYPVTLQQAQQRFQLYTW